MTVVRDSEVIYDIQRTGRRYMNTADLQLEARLLGLTSSASLWDLGKELDRRGLNDYSAGRAVKGGNA